MSSVAQEISYKVIIENPQTHYATVQIEVNQCNSTQTHIKMPVWTPGSYMVREFARNVESFAAYDANGDALEWHKDRKNSWLVKNGNVSNFVVRYNVYANEVTVRTSFVNSETAFLLGTSLLMSVEGFERTKGYIEIVKPAHWLNIATGLKELKGKLAKFSFTDYDELVDCPIQVGNFDTLSFRVNNIPHYVALVGENNANKDVLRADMQKICQAAFDVVGRVDMEKYWFFVQHVENAGGGLEHRNSVSLGMSANNYSDAVKYKGFLGLVAHEYFHVWNVKRIRPIELGPFDYDNENYTKMLWMSEGFTSYYDKFIPYKSGFLTQEEFLGRVAGMISYTENTPGARYQSLAESSFDAWIKAYRPDENSVNSSISYYTKGSLAGALLDLYIIRATNGKKCLDDLFQYLYNEYYLLKKRGFTEAEFRNAAEMIAGVKLNDYFNEIVYGTSTPDYLSLFNAFGIEFSAIPSTDPYLGLNVSRKGDRNIVNSVLRNSNAAIVGINAGDVIVSINGIESIDNFQDFLNQFNTGDTLSVKVKRGDKELVFETKLDTNPNQVFTLQMRQNLDAQQQILLDKWFKR